MAAAAAAAAAAVVGMPDRTEAADTWSDPDPAGEAPMADVVAEGDVVCDDGVGRLLGEVTEGGGWRPGIDGGCVVVIRGSTFGGFDEMPVAKPYLNPRE